MFRPDNPNWRLAPRGGLAHMTAAIGAASEKMPKFTAHADPASQ